MSRLQLLSLGVELFRTVVDMEPGEIEGPIRREWELWIVRMDGRREGRPMSFGEARQRVENHLGNQRVQVLRRRIEAEVLREIALEVRQ